MALKPMLARDPVRGASSLDNGLPAILAPAVLEIVRQTETFEVIQILDRTPAAIRTEVIAHAMQRTSSKAVRLGLTKFARHIGIVARQTV